MRFLSVLYKLFLPLCQPGSAGESEIKSEVERGGGGGGEGDRPGDPGRVRPGVQPVPAGRVQGVAGPPGQVDLGGGEPVHVRGRRGQAGDVEGSLASSEQGRDGGDVWLVAHCQAEIMCNVIQELTRVSGLPSVPPHHIYYSPKLIRFFPRHVLFAET